jgi:hypothetical protein
MTAYPTDFPGAPYSVEPVPPEVLVGLGPLLTLLLGVAVIAAIAAAWLAGRTWGPGRKPADAIDAIHRELLHAAVIAMSAGDAELPGRARALRAVITARLGPLLQVAKGAGGPVKALDQALAGKKEVEVPAPQPDTPHGATPPPHPGYAPAAAAAASAGAPVIVNVLGGVAEAPRPAEPPKPHDPPVAPPPSPPPAPKPEKKTVDMTLDEQVQALTLAVRQFHGWWADVAPRKAELREVIKALTTPPPRPILHGRPGHDQGHGHGPGQGL